MLLRSLPLSHSNENTNMSNHHHHQQTAQQHGHHNNSNGNGNGGGGGTGRHYTEMMPSKHQTAFLSQHLGGGGGGGHHGSIIDGIKQESTPMCQLSNMGTTKSLLNGPVIPMDTSGRYYSEDTLLSSDSSTISETILASEDSCFSNHSTITNPHSTNGNAANNNNNNVEMTTNFIGQMTDATLTSLSNVSPVVVTSSVISPLLTPVVSPIVAPVIPPVVTSQVVSPIVPQVLTPSLSPQQPQPQQQPLLTQSTLNENVITNDPPCQEQPDQKPVIITGQPPTVIEASQISAMTQMSDNELIRLINPSTFDEFKEGCFPTFIGSSL